MTKRTNKKRFNAFINEKTYNKVNEFVKNNELINARLVPGAVLEMGLALFFKELQTRSLEDIAVEYLIGDGNNDWLFENHHYRFFKSHN